MGSRSCVTFSTSWDSGDLGLGLRCTRESEGTELAPISRGGTESRDVRVGTCDVVVDSDTSVRLGTRRGGGVGPWLSKGRGRPIVVLELF